MEIRYFDSFDKDLNRISDATIMDRIEKAIENVENAASLYDIPQLEKLKGHRTAYRIRVGVLRLGVYIENGVVSFKCCQHCSKVYKVFP